MGLALDCDGELFVTDNQGNYKPFNELNHVRPGAHFGFINSLDRTNPLRRARRPPSTSRIRGRAASTASVSSTRRRSCGTSSAAMLFGPLEGHLIGCEYDTRRLIRMTLQRSATPTRERPIR